MLQKKPRHPKQVPHKYPNTEAELQPEGLAEPGDQNWMNTHLPVSILSSSGGMPCFRGLIKHAFRWTRGSAAALGFGAVQLCAFAICPNPKTSKPSAAKAPKGLDKSPAGWKCFRFVADCTFKKAIEILDCSGPQLTEF